MPDAEVFDLKVQFIVNRSRLRDAAARILGCRQRAEDVVQDAFVKSMKSRPALPQASASGLFLRFLARRMDPEVRQRIDSVASFVKH